MSPARKSILTLLIGFFFAASALVLPSFTKASPIPTGPWYNPSLEQFRGRVLNSPPDEIFGERYTFAQVIWIIRTLQLQAIPNLEDPAIRDQFEDMLGYTGPSSPQNYANLGLTGLMAGTIGDMYGNPVSSARTELNRTLSVFDLASPVSAQGYGFGATSSIRPLWAAARNTAYFVMIILLITSGFLIMFRVKVNPQTAVSLQLMIPKIIITLIGITFSYAIAGLVIDLVYLLVGLVVYLLSAAPGSPVTDARVAFDFFGQPGFIRFFFFYLVIWLVVILGQILSLDTFGAIVSLILTIIILLLLFRVWWMLLRTYINLLLLIVVGPWQIMLGLLPGNSGFSSWFRNFVSHASVFVVVPLMFLFSVALTPPVQGLPLISWLANLATQWVVGNITGVDPGILAGGSLPEFPLFGAQGNIFRYAIVFGILAIIPKTAEIIRDALKVPPFKYGSAFGEATYGPIVQGGNIAQFGRKSWQAIQPAAAGAAGARVATPTIGGAPTISHTP